MRSLRDPESHVPHRVRRPGLGDDRAHAFHGRHGTGRVVVVGEQDEQSVATELDDVAAPLLACLDHLAEAAIQQIGQLLGPFVPETCQTFGQCGEAADVGRHEGALEDQQTVARATALDVLDETRDVAGQDRAPRRSLRVPSARGHHISLASPLQFEREGVDRPARITLDHERQRHVARLGVRSS